jgi:KUP system potassium uptake protein
VAVLLAVLGFGSSSALASAYGIAVTVTMLITTGADLLCGAPRLALPAARGPGRHRGFLALDALLVVSCALKFLQGGWFPLVLGVRCSPS